MILVDKFLAKREHDCNPIRVGMVGAGFMGRAVAAQLVRYSPGLRLSAIGNRTLSAAELAYTNAGINSFSYVSSKRQLEERIFKSEYAVTDDPMILCQADNIDVIVEVTGSVDFGARVVMEAIKNKKHVVLINAELDATLGPILKKFADNKGVIYTNADGDQPAVEMNLVRYVRGIGLRPVVCGNMKGLHDPYRTPDSQKEFASKWGMNPAKASSFADGTKLSFEQAVVANATGMTVAKRGMYGFPAHGLTLDEAVKQFPEESVLNGPGLVDYLLGGEPGAGVFVLGTTDDPQQKSMLKLLKLGAGPLYLFYTPFHLCHMDVAATCARAVLFNDAAIAPVGKPSVEVVATAKRDLKAGEVIDGLGGFMTYGQCESAQIASTLQLLPMGLAENCTLISDVGMDRVITYNDIILPVERFSDQLKAYQDEVFINASMYNHYRY